MPGADDLRRIFSIPPAVKIVKPAKYVVPQGTAVDKALRTSALGTPVYTDLTFLSVEYQTTPGYLAITENLTLDAVLVTVVQPKKIIKTEIAGRSGTVKEYIGLGDYELQINGVITGPNGVYPLEQTSLLKDMLDAPVAIPIASEYLNGLGISYIVVERYEFMQDAGSQSYQAFTINAISDVPQELRILGE